MAACSVSVARALAREASSTGVVAGAAGAIVVVGFALRVVVVLRRFAADRTDFFVVLVAPDADGEAAAATRAANRK
jgi:hypothetical protein